MYGEWKDCTLEPLWDETLPGNFRVKSLKDEVVCQWIIQVDNPKEFGFTDEFFLTGFMTEDEVKEKYKDSSNLTIVRKLVESETYRLVAK
jgi:hypothetical protein